jgi:hypothetical protein
MIPYDPPPLSHTPNPDGATEGFRLPEVLCDSAWGASQGALGVWGEAITLSLLKEPLVAFASSLGFSSPSFFP